MPGTLVYYSTETFKERYAGYNSNAASYSKPRFAVVNCRIGIANLN